MSVLELLKFKKSEDKAERTGLMGIIITALKEDDWSFECDSERPELLRTSVKGRNTDMRGTFLIRQEKDQVTFYVQLPSKAPEGRQREAMEFITRANYGMNIGNFEMDMQDGEIRFKVALDVEAGILSTIMVRNMMTAAFFTVDRYFPGLMSVLFGNAIPAAAVREIEVSE